MALVLRQQRASRDLRGRPNTYAPQYGGFCTHSMAEGNIAAIDPHLWRIINGRLYLFSGEPSDLEKDFDPDPAGVISRADINWPQAKADIESN
jgi:hypothetical protein